MKILLDHNEKQWNVHLDEAIDISIPFSTSSDGVRCFGANPIQTKAVEAEGFIGDVSRGGPVNFFDVQLNVHGNGTHTECVGHINSAKTSIGQVLDTFHFVARLVTIIPEDLNGDEVITTSQLKNLVPLNEVALVVRTMPNDNQKKTKNYTQTNPAYFEPAALEVLKEQGVKHLIIDLPSVDKEMDGGAVQAHKTWWDFPSTAISERTITELVFIPDHVEDGLYLINLQVAPVEMDAAPSRIVLYAMTLA